MYKWSMAVLLIFSMILIIGCGMSDDTVAKVGDQTVTKEEFTQALSRRYPQQEDYKNVPKKDKMEMLNRLIDRKLQVTAAIDRNLDEEVKTQKEYRDRKLRILGNKYFEREIVDQLLPEEMIKEHYERQAEEVKASHILLGFKGLQRSQATRSKDEALKLAQELAKRARDGESFPDLAEEYSDDPSSEKNKGDLGYFTWGRMVQPFQEAAFSMNPGDISDPVLSDFGYHVIWVVDKRPNKNFNPEDYEKNKFNLKRNLYRTKQVEGRKMWEDHINKMKEAKNFTFKEENIDSAISWITDKAQSGRFSEDNFSESELNTGLSGWDGGEINLQNVFDMHGRNLARTVNRLKNKSQFKTDLENLTIQMMVVNEAENKGYDQEEDVSDQLNSFMEQRMISLLNNQEVNEKIDITEADMEQYYQDHTEEFTKPAEIMIWEVYVKDEDLAKKVLRMAQNGQNFKNLASRYSEDKFYQKKNGELGYKRRNSRGPVSREAFEVGPNQIAGPIKYNKGWSVIKTGDKKPEVVQSFEDVKSRVKSKVRAQMIKERQEAWKEEAKNQYAISINEQLLEQI